MKELSKAEVAAVAVAILGDPSKKSPNEMRWGQNGSVSVNLTAGTYYDHEAGDGGGILKLIETRKGLKGSDAVQWISTLGIDADEKRGAPPPREPLSKGPTAAPPARNGAQTNGAAPSSKPKLVATFDYVDEQGKLAYQICRFEYEELTKEGKPKKDFRQRRPIGAEDDPSKAKAGWIWSTKGVRLFPYHLPEIRRAIGHGYLIFICEGEKAADAIRNLGHPATTNPGGAKNWKDDLNEHFAGADVVILPDNDGAGQEHAQEVASKLHGIAKRIRILDLPGLGPKDDAFEWVARGGSAESLVDEVARSARDYAPVFHSRYGRLAWADLDKPGPEVEFLIDDFVTLGDKSVIGGPSQSGKSFLSIHASLCVARGVPFFGRPVKRGLVVYQAGEGARGIKKRLRAYRQHFGVAPGEYVPFELLQSPINLWRADGDTDGLIAEINGIKKLHPDVPLVWIVIDTLATAMAGADEISFRDMGAIMQNIDRLKDQTSAGICLVHHMNAGGNKLRGHTSLYAGLDQAVFVQKNEKTGTRTVICDKMKDDEGGHNFRFDLAAIEIGQRPDGRPITSCVCVDPGTKEEVYAQEAKKRNFRLSDNEQMIFGALLAALKKHGEQAPSEVGAPLGANVVKASHWKQEIAMVAPWDDGDQSEAAEKKRNLRINKALERAGTFLLRHRIIGRSNPYVWLNGRPVAGFPETYGVPGDDVTVSGSDNSAADDDISGLIR